MSNVSHLAHFISRPTIDDRMMSSYELEDALASEPSVIDFANIDQLTRSAIQLLREYLLGNNVEITDVNSRLFRNLIIECGFALEESMQ